MPQRKPCSELSRRSRTCTMTTPDSSYNDIYDEPVEAAMQETLNRLGTLRSTVSAYRLSSSSDRMIVEALRQNARQHRAGADLRSSGALSAPRTHSRIGRSTLTLRLAAAIAAL